MPYHVPESYVMGLYPASPQRRLNIKSAGRRIYASQNLVKKMPMVKRQRKTNVKHEKVCVAKKSGRPILLRQKIPIAGYWDLEKDVGSVFVYHQEAWPGPLGLP